MTTEEQNPTIKIDPKVKDKLDKIKIIEEETYNSVILRLLEKKK